MSKKSCQIVGEPACVCMNVQESKLDKFMRLGSYDTVRQIKRDKFKGQWRNLSEASRKTGISRPTIYKILEGYPEKIQAKAFS